MNEAAPEALGRRSLEVPQQVIDVSRVSTDAGANRLGTIAQLEIVICPRALNGVEPEQFCLQGWIATRHSSTLSE